METKNLKTVKTYFRNNPKYGRTTTLINVITEEKLITVMGIATKADCIYAYNKAINK